MKTQISRDSHDPEKSYSGVYQQQGRMITDADWNELVDVVKRLIQDAVADIIGRGAPQRRGVVGKDAAGNPFLQWGYVYADGLMGEVKRDPDKPDVFSLLNQRDLPLADSQLPEEGVEVRLYVDLWERTVGSLEDPGLADPALNGADTCARTQAMAQVKWCPAGLIDPEIPAQNPPIGDSALSLSPLEPPQEDYLFRLEVHDAEFGGNLALTRLVLKWSSENAAEAVLLSENGALPPQFQDESYAYERYTDTQEKNLGTHFGYTPSRGELSPFEPSPVAPGRYYLRRWDGYCELNADADDNWSIKDDMSCDRGRKLELVPGDPGAHGEVSISGTKIQIRLLHLLLEFDLGPAVLAGDYWQAVVRKSAGKDGCVTVLNRGKPLGIRHRYLSLGKGTVNRDGTVQALELAEGPDRSLTFPALADLAAEYVRKIGDTMSGKLTIGAADNAAESDMLEVNGTTSTKALIVDSGTAPQKNDVLTAMDATGKAIWAPPPQPPVFGWKQVDNEPILQTFLQTNDDPTEAVAVRIGDPTKKHLVFSENKIDALEQQVTYHGTPPLPVVTQAPIPLLVNNDPALTAYAQAVVQVNETDITFRLLGFDSAVLENGAVSLKTNSDNKGKSLMPSDVMVFFNATQPNMLLHSFLTTQTEHSLTITVTNQDGTIAPAFTLNVSVFLKHFS